jgi:hypothetical protein
MSLQLELITEKGAIVITEADLPMSDKVLAMLRISREDLGQCFAEAKKLMERAKDGERPRGEPTSDGKWAVILPIEVTEETRAVC